MWFGGIFDCGSGAISAVVWGHFWLWFVGNFGCGLWEILTVVCGHFWLWFVGNFDWGIYGCGCGLGTFMVADCLGVFLTVVWGNSWVEFGAILVVVWLLFGIGNIYLWFLGEFTSGWSLGDFFVCVYYCL